MGSKRAGLNIDSLEAAESPAWVCVTIGVCLWMLQGTDIVWSPKTKVAKQIDNLAGLSGSSEDEIYITFLVV